MHSASFMKLPRRVANRTDLSATAKLVVAALHGHAWGLKDYAWPSIKTIARDIGESESATKRAVKQLLAAGLLLAERRKDPNNPLMNLSNMYTLVNIDEEGFEMNPPSI